MTRAFSGALRGLLGLAALGATSFPVEAKACSTTESVTAQILRESSSSEIQLIDGALAGRLQTGISALIGQQVPLGGQYLLAHVPGALTSYIVRFEGGCATHHGRFFARTGTRLAGR